MPLLDRTGMLNDGWTRVGAADLGAVPQALVPFVEIDAALAALAGNQLLGVEVANTLDVDAISPAWLQALSLIAVAFPAFGDGRGYSIGKKLRRAGFAGRLRAVGPLIADQFAFALACGFDEIELPEAAAARQPVEQWLAAAARLEVTYQPGPNGEPSIFERRRAARGGAA